MKSLRKLIAAAALAAVSLTTAIPAVSADLSNAPFVKQAANRANYEPGGKYHLFGSRGSVAGRSGHISVTPTSVHQIGNLEFSRAKISGNIGYTVRFSGHGHEVHSPFDNNASRSASERSGSIVSGGAASYQLEWSGHEHHPRDGYDGPQGGGYPAPKGARDIYSYRINGTAQSTRLNLTDNRTTEQRFFDRFKNAGNMLTQGIGSNFQQMTENNPNLNRWGNAAEAVNGLAGMVGNIAGAAGEIIGVGDAVQGIGFGIDYATGAGLDAAGSAEDDIRFADTVIRAENAKNKVVRSVQGFADANPNTAEGMKAVVNAATAGYGAAAKGAGAAKTAGAGKAAVSEDFSDAYKTKSNFDYSKISTGRTEAKTLKEQLAMESVKSNPKGRILPIKMNDSKNNLYVEDGWVKKAQNINGVEIHYVENTKTGIKADFKFKD